MPRVRHRLEAADVDHGQLVGRRLEDVAVVVDLDELAPVGGRATSGRHRWWLERFAEVRENLADGPRLRDERDQPDVAPAVWALKWKLLPHPGQEFRPCNPRRVVRSGLLMRVRAAPRGATAGRLPIGRSLAPFADIPESERSNGGPELVIGRKDAVIAMPVLPRRRHEVSEPVEELKRRELDDAVGPRPRGPAAAAGPDPVGGFVPDPRLRRRDFLAGRRSLVFRRLINAGIFRGLGRCLTMEGGG